MGLVRFLSRAEPRAAPGSTADAIFVFAGGQARKVHAAEAWRRGRAPVLVVSVARFEWRRYSGLGLPGFDALSAAVDRVPPRERHFLVLLEGASEGPRVSVRRVPMRRFGTRNEARALRELATERGVRSLLVISSEFHLRRVALVVGRALAGTGIGVAYEAPPHGLDPHAPGQWWRSRRGIGLVTSEVIKLGIYEWLLGP